MTNTYNTCINLPIIDMCATGQRIQFYRQLNNYSVQDLQKIFGFRHPQAIYNWLSGKTLPSIDNLLVLSELFSVSINEILGQSELTASFCA